MCTGKGDQDINWQIKWLGLSVLLLGTVRYIMTAGQLQERALSLGVN